MTNDAPALPEIRTDLRPGDLGRLIAFHATAFEGDEAHFGVKFEAFVARLMAEFVLDGAPGQIFMAEQDGTLVGCAAMIERAQAGAASCGQLRWVLAAPSSRGTGLGERLVRSAIDYARDNGWREVVLETTEGLDAAMGLYKKLGFVETERTVEQLWRDDMTVIKMALALDYGRS